MLVALCRLCVRTEEAAASVASACPERAQVPSTLCSPPEPARARERPSFDFPPLTEAAAAPAAHLCPFRTPRLTACCAAPAGPPSRRRFTGSSAPSSGPSAAPSGMPSSMPSTLPSGAPSAEPSAAPSTAPSAVPSASLLILPSAIPTFPSPVVPPQQLPPSPPRAPSPPSPPPHTCLAATFSWFDTSGVCAIRVAARTCQSSIAHHHQQHVAEG